MNRTRKEMLKWLLIQREAGKQRFHESKQQYKRYPWYAKILMFNDYMLDCVAERSVEVAIDIAIMRMESYWKFYYKHGERMTELVGFAYPTHFDVSVSSHGVFFITTHTTKYNIQSMMEKYPC